MTMAMRRISLLGDPNIYRRGESANPAETSTATDGAGALIARTNATASAHEPTPSGKSN
jgi:hypothetical protein